MTVRLAFNFLGTELTFSHLTMFLTGLFAGVAIMFMIYLIVLASSLKPPKIKVAFDDKKFPAEELSALVEEKHRDFKEKSAKAQTAEQFVICKDVAVDTVTEIAKRFYPKSKHPCLELNVSEVLVLNRVVTARLEGIFNKPVVRWFRKLKVSQVVGVYDIKKKIDDNEPLQKILGVTKDASALLKAIRWNKPSTWVGFGLGKLFNLVTSKVCMIGISCVAEESYKIYSKKFMKEGITVDTGAERLLDDVKLTAELESGDEELTKV